MKRTDTLMNVGLGALRFVITVILAFLVYQALFSRIFTDSIHIFTYLFFWFFSAYIILPWFYRLFAKLYVPDYFIGRTRTSDGLLGDPVNLAFYGTREELIESFEQSGWHLADPLNLATGFKISVASVFGKSYPTAPVSPLFLFSRKQDLAFEKEIHNNPRKRHHIRLWQSPPDWHLPGGEMADWLGAAALDQNVGLSLFTGQITHKIDADTDKERDFVVESLAASPNMEKVRVVEHFTSSYHSRNGGGDYIYTDGSMPFVTLKKKE